MKKAWAIFAAVIALLMLANAAYFIKTALGIKITRQTHHGWLFPIADKALKHFHLAGEREQ